MADSLSDRTVSRTMRAEGPFWLYLLGDCLPSLRQPDEGLQRPRRFLAIRMHPAMTLAWREKNFVRTLHNGLRDRDRKLSRAFPFIRQGDSAFFWQRGKTLNLLQDCNVHASWEAPTPAAMAHLAKRTLATVEWIMSKPQQKDISKAMLFVSYTRRKQLRRGKYDLHVLMTV